MATYTKEQLQENVELASAYTTLFNDIMDSMSTRSLAGYYDYTTDVITSESIRNQLKQALQAAPLSFTVTELQETQTLKIDWSL